MSEDTEAKIARIDERMSALIDGMRRIEDRMSDFATRDMLDEVRRRVAAAEKASISMDAAEEIRRRLSNLERAGGILVTFVVLGVLAAIIINVIPAFSG